MCGVLVTSRLTCALLWTLKPTVSAISSVHIFVCAAVSSLGVCLTCSSTFCGNDMPGGGQEDGLAWLDNDVGASFPFAVLCNM